MRRVVLAAVVPFVIATHAACESEEPKEERAFVHLTFHDQACEDDVDFVCGSP